MSTTSQHKIWHTNTEAPSVLTLEPVTKQRMSSPPARHSALSFRPKITSDFSSQLQSASSESSCNTAAADSNLDPQLAVDMDRLHQEVVRLASRGGSHDHASYEDMTVEEAQHSIDLQAKARSRWFQATEEARLRIRARSKPKHDEQTNDDESDTDGLDDLNRLLETSPIRKNWPASDEHDDLNRLIPTNEMAVDGIAGEMDVEFGGMREVLESTAEWHESSAAERAALQHAMLSARSLGDYISRFDPQAHEQLSRMQEELFRQAGRKESSAQMPDTSSGGYVRRSSMEDKMAFGAHHQGVEALGGDGCRQDPVTRGKDGDNGSMEYSPEYNSIAQAERNDDGGNAMDID